MNIYNGALGCSIPQSVPQVKFKSFTYDASGNTIDLYRPEGGGTPPVIVYIHGGGWHRGLSTDVDIHWLVYFGYAVASVNYPLVTGVDNEFPTAVAAIRCAVRYTQQASELMIDPSHIVVVGESAGGNLAGMMQPNIPYEEQGCNVGTTSQLQVQGIADYYGINNGYELNKPLVQLLTQYLGVSPRIDPQLAAEASGQMYLGSNSPALFIAYGEQDTRVPITQSIDFYDSAISSGVDAQIFPVPGLGHGFHIFDVAEYPQLEASACGFLSFLGAVYEMNRMSAGVMP